MKRYPIQIILLSFFSFFDVMMKIFKNGCLKDVITMFKKREGCQRLKGIL